MVEAYARHGADRKYRSAVPVLELVLWAAFPAIPASGHIDAYL